ncbi:GtrA family protein [Mesobacterium pallidum]|uniref:GtrA family protein n=1 Tax=Mesobacterium pallidum TaxID=2872037 RepID=UPI001EE33734
MKLVLLYTLFAVIATLANLGTQRLVIGEALTGPRFIAGLVLGTGVGLVIKYILDKRWIFDDRETGAKAHTKKFAGYTLMGVATTAIFWGFEAAFWYATESHAMRELGAVIGLGIGYVTKYRLDRAFVFTRTEAAS